MQGLINDLLIHGTTPDLLAKATTILTQPRKSPKNIVFTIQNASFDHLDYLNLKLNYEKNKTKGKFRLVVLNNSAYIGKAFFEIKRDNFLGSIKISYYGLEDAEFTGKKFQIDRELFPLTTPKNILKILITSAKGQNIVSNVLVIEIFRNRHDQRVVKRVSAFATSCTQLLPEMTESMCFIILNYIIYVCYYTELQNLTISVHDKRKRALPAASPVAKEPAKKRQKRQKHEKEENDLSDDDVDDDKDAVDDSKMYDNDDVDDSNKNKKKKDSKMYDNDDNDDNVDSKMYDKDDVDDSNKNKKKKDSDDDDEETEDSDIDLMVKIVEKYDETEVSAYFKKISETRCFWHSTIMEQHALLPVLFYCISVANSCSKTTILTTIGTDTKISRYAESVKNYFKQEISHNFYTLMDLLLKNHPESIVHKKVEQSNKNPYYVYNNPNKMLKSLGMCLYFIKLIFYVL